LLMASAMNQISAWAYGVGQEVVTTCILGIALGMLSWHCIWVSPNSNQRVLDAKQIGAAAAHGNKAIWSLAVAVALSVLREGAETVLFVSGLISGSPESQFELISSASLGIAMGTFAGWLIYTGLGQIKAYRLFVITNILILMLAGSLASQLAKTANQAGWVSLFEDHAWDISALLPNDSPIGMVLHGVLGFEASPTQLQVLVYVGTTTLIWMAARLMKLHVSARQTALITTI